MSTLSFKGVVGGVTYDDPGLFEVAARALGFRGYGRREPAWKIGTAICLTLEDGTKVEGQVWSLAPKDKTVWVALNDGTYAEVQTRSGIAYIDADHVGRVAV